MSSLHDKLEAIKAHVWAEIAHYAPEVRAELEHLFAGVKADAEAEAGKVRAELAADLVPVIARFRTALDQAIEAAGPSVTADVQQAEQAVFAELSRILGVNL